MIWFVILLCVGSVVSQGIQKDSSVCSLPPEIGTCRAAFPAFFFNSELGLCDCFIYGGCNPSGNLFTTLQQCSDTCGVNPMLRFITPNCRRLFPSRLTTTTTTTQRPTAPPQPSTNENQRFNQTSLSQLENIFNRIVSNNNQQNSAARPSDQFQPSQQDFQPQPSQQAFRPSSQSNQQDFQPQPSQQAFRPSSQSVQSQSVPQRPRPQPAVQLDIPEPRPGPQTTLVRAPPKKEGPIFPPRVPGVTESAAVLAQRRQQQQLQNTIRRQQEFERREQIKNEEHLQQQRQQLQQQSNSQRTG